MLVDLKTILADTREKHYAVGLFNCVTLEMTKGILAAAEELHSPVIIGPAESLLAGAGGRSHPPGLFLRYVRLQHAAL